MFKNYYISYALILFLMLLQIRLWSQKAHSIHSFEKPLEVIAEDSYHENHMRISAESGFPLAIYNPQFAVSPGDPQAMAMEYLQANKTLLGLSNQDIDNLVLHAIRESLSGTTVRLRQHWNDIPVGKAEITIQIDRQNKVSFVMNGFRYGVQVDQIGPKKSPEFARQLLIDQVGIKDITQENQHLEVFHQNGDSKLIHRVNIISNEPNGEWEAFIDAQSGEILKLENIAFYYHDHQEALAPGIAPARIFTLLVNGSGVAFVPDPLSSANADYGDPGFSDNSDATSTQLDAETVTITLEDITFDGTNYSLVGPWAEIVDTEGPFNGLFSQSSSTWNYNRFDDGFEATNTYYHIDQSMRYINNTLGLSIQPTDYSGGVKFDPHGLNGADNSHYLGGSQTVTFGEGGVDDAEDSDVIHHELGHGLHDWVTNGGLSQVNGLSEGCGDYWAASYNRSLGDWDPSDPQYNWVFNWDGHNNFWNGRVVNYAPIYPGGLVGQIHTDGQIWSTAMMKVWDAIGGTLSDKAFWEGIGMTNGSSNQDDAANAVYQAAINMGYSNADLSSMHDELTSSGYTLPAPPLSIELETFTGRKEGKNIKLFWTTLSETDHDYFQLERSTDGLNFAALDKIPGRSNGFESADYHYTDTQPYPALNYYRLKQVDLEGNYTYSKILSFRFENENITVFPNPAKNRLTVESAALNDPHVVLSIYDRVGKLRQSAGFQQAKNGTMELDISSLEIGWYALKIQSGGQVEMVRFLKQ